MERVLNTALSGLRFNDHKQSMITNNLANLSTAGFRQELVNARHIPMNSGGGLPMQHLVAATTPTSDFKSGALQQTGRPLDVAIIGQGWLVVDLGDGEYGMTRDGALRMANDGTLFADGHPIVDKDNQPIQVPPGAEIGIGPDGTISMLAAGDQAKAVSELARLKLVNPDKEQLVRGEDGFFRVKDGLALEHKEDIRLRSGATEGSNVNAVEMMVSMITNARHYDMHMKLIKMADENMRGSNQLLSIRG